MTPSNRSDRGGVTDSCGAQNSIPSKLRQGGADKEDGSPSRLRIALWTPISDGPGPLGPVSIEACDVGDHRPALRFGGARRPAGSGAMMSRPLGRDATGSDRLAVDEAGRESRRSVVAAAVILPAIGCPVWGQQATRPRPAAGWRSDPGRGDRLSVAAVESGDRATNILRATFRAMASGPRLDSQPDLVLVDGNVFHRCRCARGDSRHQSSRDFRA